jgi:hypothetical protein
MHPSCFVAFQPLGSLRSSPPKQLSPLELDKEGIDVNLEYLDDVSVFGCDFDDDVLDHGNTGSDDDFDDNNNDARTQTAGDKHLLYEFDWEGSDDDYKNVDEDKDDEDEFKDDKPRKQTVGELDVGSNLDISTLNDDTKDTFTAQEGVSLAAEKDLLDLRGCPSMVNHLSKVDSLLERRTAEETSLARLNHHYGVTQGELEVVTPQSFCSIMDT